MYSRRLKNGYFILEGLNSFATVCYFYYYYFFMQQRFGYGNRANLLLAALNGGLYAVFAWAGGRFGQRFGYFRALKLGFGVMIVSFGVGSQLDGTLAHILVMCVATVGMSTTWPALEALVSEEETPVGLQHRVGTYNVVWAATGSFAYFIGGAMLEHLGLQSMFYVPIGVLLVQLGLTLWLEAEAHREMAQAGAAPRLPEPEPEVHASAQAPPERAKSFLRMAWLANPFAYIAINTVLAVVPGVARRLELSTTMAGFCCSTWCFARLGAFALLWYWTGWHYRFRWLIGAYLGLVASFALLLLAPNLAALIATQVVFGGAIGLIYYSSLFYSMDRSDTKGEHGGIHEAAIGLGNLAGPAVGATSLYLLPQQANSAAWAVSGLLLVGLGGLTLIWRSGLKAAKSPGAGGR